MNTKNNNLHIDITGLNLIKDFEGCVLHPYLDQGGTPTIGWGMTYYPNTGKKVTMLDKALTQDLADEYFVLMVEPYVSGVLENVTVEINQNQLNALTSFCYNLGVHTLTQSYLLQRINSGEEVIEEDFTIYSHAAGKEVVGLFNRRVSEYNLFITKVPVNAVPTAPINTPMETSKIKFVKFFNSSTMQVVTVFADQNYVVQNDGETFAFSDAADAQSKCTNEVFLFWDNAPVGVGHQTA